MGTWLYVSLPLFYSYNLDQYFFFRRHFIRLLSSMHQTNEVLHSCSAIHSMFMKVAMFSLCLRVVYSTVRSLKRMGFIAQYFYKYWYTRTEAKKYLNYISTCWRLLCFYFINWQLKVFNVRRVVCGKVMGNGKCNSPQITENSIQYSISGLHVSYVL